MLCLPLLDLAVFFDLGDFRADLGDFMDDLGVPAAALLSSLDDLDRGEKGDLDLDDFLEGDLDREDDKRKGDLALGMI